MLRRFARAVVRERKQVLAIAALLTILGAYGTLNASINYDLLSYLPDDLPSVQGFELLNEEFALGDTAQILVEDASDIEARELTERIAAIEGVNSVNWVTDFQKLEVPREFWDAAVRDNYFSEDATIIQASFDHPQNDPRTATAYSELRDVLGGRTASVAGLVQLDLQEVIDRDRVRFAVAALVLVTAVLLLTLPSIAVPMTFVVTIGSAVLINLGLSYYLGQEISYLTGVIVFALQFAVTMDYALFLYHRFEEEKQTGLAEEEAMVEAIATTFKSIVVASLTTMAGFLALSVMQLGFGKDMGLTLARGVLITVVAVMTVLPALLLTFARVIDRVRHPVKQLDFAGLGGLIGRHAGKLALLALLLFVPALWGYSKLTLNYNINEGLPADLPSLTAQDRIAETFGRKETLFLVAEDTGSRVDIETLNDRAKQLPGVTGTFAYTELVDPRIPEEFVPSEAREAFFANDHTYIGVDSQYEIGDAGLEKQIAALDDIAEEHVSQTYVTGQAVLVKDLEEVSAGDIDLVNIISVLAIFIMIAIAFKSLVIPIVLVGLIQLAILMNQAFSGYAGTEIIFIASLAIGAIQLGATVDYAILLTTRYEEALAKGGNPRQAVAKALGGGGQSILVSAGTMFAATLGMVLMSTLATISDLALLISRGALISFAVVVLLLPGVLVALQPLLERTSLGWPKARRKEG